MNDTVTISEGSTFCVQVHRYDNPDGIRFYYYRPAVGDEEYRIDAVHPFDSGTVFGPGYIETERQQVDAETAQETMLSLSEDHDMVPLLALPLVLGNWIEFSICPIEWHDGFRRGDVSLAERVLVWVKR